MRYGHPCAHGKYRRLMKKVALSSSFFPCLALVEAGLVALDDLGDAVGHPAIFKMDTPQGAPR